MILVKWWDAESNDTWLDRDSFIGSPLPLIETVGILLEENSKMVVLAQNYDSMNDKASMVMRIPKSMIDKMFAITSGKKALRV